MLHSVLLHFLLCRYLNQPELLRLLHLLCYNLRQVTECHQVRLSGLQVRVLHHKLLHLYLHLLSLLLPVLLPESSMHHLLHSYLYPELLQLRSVYSEHLCLLLLPLVYFLLLLLFCLLRESLLLLPTSLSGLQLLQEV